MANNILLKILYCLNYTMNVYKKDMLINIALNNIEMYSNINSISLNNIFVLV